MVWFSVQILSETFLILKIIQQDIIKNVYRSSCKVPLFLSDINRTWNFSPDFFFPKNTEIPNFMKIHPMVSEMFHADRHHEASSCAFRIFAREEKKSARKYFGHYSVHCTAFALRFSANTSELFVTLWQLIARLLYAGVNPPNIDENYRNFVLWMVIKRSFWQPEFIVYLCACAKSYNWITNL